jgi:flagellar L-ring protein precursor FlgH
MMNRPVRLAILLLAGAALSGCSTLMNIGRAPPLSPIKNPVTQHGYKPISLPMPAPDNEVHQPNSLWRTGAKAFFRDQRAAKVGDILTVNISIDDSAKLNNSTERSRTGSEQMGVSNILGLESYLHDILPEAVDKANLAKFGSTGASKGDGSIDRAETIKLTIAAIVTQVLPNGNLVIEGHQEVRVNYEKRELLITGIVRPEDISNANTINNSQIAEERVSYGGQGEISKLQQPRYGQQLYDTISPF